LKTAEIQDITRLFSSALYFTALETSLGSYPVLKLSLINLAGISVVCAGWLQYLLV